MMAKTSSFIKASYMNFPREQQLRLTCSYNTLPVLPEETPGGSYSDQLRLSNQRSELSLHLNLRRRLLKQRRRLLSSPSITSHIPCFRSPQKNQSQTSNLPRFPSEGAKPWLKGQVRRQSLHRTEKPSHPYIWQIPRGIWVYWNALVWKA